MEHRYEWDCIEQTVNWIKGHVFIPETETNKKMTIRNRFSSAQPIFDSSYFLKIRIRFAFGLWFILARSLGTCNIYWWFTWRLDDYRLRKQRMSELCRTWNSIEPSVGRNSWLSLVHVYWFFNLVRLLVADCSLVFINLAHLSLVLEDFNHLYSGILSGILSSGILICSSDSR